jgi:PAS domain S-box-containing protein
MTRILQLLLIVILLLLTGCADSADTNAPRAVRGEIDLSERNFKMQGPTSLDGEWEFYLCSGNASNLRECLPSSGQKDYFPLPSVWEGKTAEGVPLEPEGRGAYRLNVRLDDDGKPKCLYLSGLLSVCRVSVNGRGLAESGVIGNDAESEKPRQHLLTPCFFPKDGRNEIILEVSNFHNAQGGIHSGARIGDRDQIEDMISLRRVTGAVTGGALLIMGIFHLVIFWMRKANKENLYFGLFCIVWCVETVVNPQSAFLATRFLKIPWDCYIDICLLPFGLAIPLLLLFYHAVFPKKIGKIVNGIYIVIGGSFFLYILATPPNAYSDVAFGYYLISRTAYIYLFAAFTMDLIQKRKGAAFLAPGYLALGYSEFDGILFDLNIINSTEFTHLGAFIFILSYSALMSLRFAETLAKIDDVSEELESRKEAESEQLRIQNQFSKMLDSIEDAVVAVGGEYEINFCNRAFTALTGYRFKDIQGKNIAAFIGEAGSGDAGAGCEKLPKLPLSPTSPPPPEMRQLLTSNGTALDTSVKVSLLDFEKNLYSVVFRTQEKPMDKRDLGVRIMLLALECWESTGRTKADLAEESGIWSAYIEKDGYVRTQTLDRYLSKKNLPARPRWKNIIATAEFVMAQSPKNSPLRAKLERALSRFKQLS